MARSRSKAPSGRTRNASPGCFSSPSGVGVSPGNHRAPCAGGGCVQSPGLWGHGTTSSLGGGPASPTEVSGAPGRPPGAQGRRSTAPQASQGRCLWGQPVVARRQAGAGPEHRPSPRGPVVRSNTSAGKPGPARPVMNRQEGQRGGAGSVVRCAARAAGEGKCPRQPACAGASRAPSPLAAAPPHLAAARPAVGTPAPAPGHADPCLAPRHTSCPACAGPRTPTMLYVRDPVQNFTTVGADPRRPPGGPSWEAGGGLFSPLSPGPAPVAGWGPPSRVSQGRQDGLGRMHGWGAGPGHRGHLVGFGTGTHWLGEEGSGCRPALGGCPEMWGFLRLPSFGLGTLSQAQGPPSALPCPRLPGAQGTVEVALAPGVGL